MQRQRDGEAAEGITEQPAAADKRQAEKLCLQRLDRRCRLALGLGSEGSRPSTLARLAATHATPEDVNRLWELQQDGLNALAINDSEALVQANAALHTQINSLAGNSVLARHIGLVERRWRWYYLPIAQPRGHDAWAEHAELIKAIAARDAALASDIMHRHTERTRQTYHEQRLARRNAE